MRAQFVYENVHFERGKDPKRAMDIGLLSKLRDLLNDPDYKDWFEDVLNEDRDQTIPMWQSGIDGLSRDGKIHGNYQFIGDMEMMEYDFPEIASEIKRIIKDLPVTGEGEVSPEKGPEWFEEELREGKLKANYKAYGNYILLIDGQSILINKDYLT